MRTHTSALDLYKAQVASFRQTTASARAAWRQIPEGAYRDFKELTSGGVSSRELRRMGHPYARSRGTGRTKDPRNSRRGVSKSYIRNKGLKTSKGLAPLLPINRQSSALYNSITLWHRSIGYSLEASVGFDAGKAGRSIYGAMPRGTKYVVPRGLWPQIRKRGMARNRAYRDVYLRGQKAAFAS